MEGHNILPFFILIQMRKIFLLSLVLSNIFSLVAQNAPYWQQQADYKMEVFMDAKNFQYKGNQELIYINNSSDTLKKVFFHLYNNAFQPGSEMDLRSQNIKDADARMVKKPKLMAKKLEKTELLI